MVDSFKKIWLVQVQLRKVFVLGGWDMVIRVLGNNGDVGRVGQLFWEIIREVLDDQLMIRVFFSFFILEEGISRNWIGIRVIIKYFCFIVGFSFFREIEVVGREIGKIMDNELRQDFNSVDRLILGECGFVKWSWGWYFGFVFYIGRRMLGIMLWI